MNQKKLLTGMLVGSCLIMLATIISPSQTIAQDEQATGPTYINFRIQTVIPGYEAEWANLRKEMSDVARDAGWPFYHVYQRLRGPGHGYLIVTPEAGVGDPSESFDRPSNLNVAESWFNAMFGTLDAQLVLSLRTYPDLATIPDGPTHPSAKFLHLRIRTAASGRGDDFEDWLREDLLPELRRIDVGDVRNARVVLGGNPRTWVTASFVDGWPYPASNENPVNSRVLAKGDAFVATRNDYFYEFREDLSFTAD